MIDSVGDISWMVVLCAKWSNQKHLSTEVWWLVVLIWGSSTCLTKVKY